MSKVYDMERGPDGVYRPKRVIEKGKQERPVNPMQGPLLPSPPNVKFVQFCRGFHQGTRYVSIARDLLRGIGFLD